MLLILKIISFKLIGICSLYYLVLNLALINWIKYNRTSISYHIIFL